MLAVCLLSEMLPGGLSVVDDYETIYWLIRNWGHCSCDRNSRLAFCFDTFSSEGIERLSITFAETPDSAIGLSSYVFCNGELQICPLRYL